MNPKQASELKQLANVIIDITGSPAMTTKFYENSEKIEITLDITLKAK